MTTLNERAQLGTEIRARFGGGTPSSGSVPGSRDMAPDLHRIADEALFGSIWRRPALKIEHREMIVLSVLTVLQRENQLRRHVANAIVLGLTAQQVIEVMIHASFYGGVPTAFTSMGVAKEVFAANDVPFVDAIAATDQHRDEMASYVHLTPAANRRIAAAFADVIWDQTCGSRT